MRTKQMAAVAAVALTIPLAACGGGDSGGDSSEAEGNYPSETLDWTIAFGPGGGNDIMARTMIDILKKEDLYPENIEVQNREGGSGATGWGYLFSQSGEGYGISTTSGSFITTPLQADTGWQPSDFTPVGLFATDDALFLVKGDSPTKDWDGWVDLAKKERLVVGGIGTVNVDFIVSAMLAEQAGYEVEYVPFNEEGQLQTSLLSGAVDAHDLQPRLDPRPDRVRRRARAGLHRRRAPRRAARRPDRPGARLRGHPLDAARDDPAAGRPGRGAGVVDLDDEEGHRDPGVGRLHRGELPHRGRPLG